MNVIQKIEILLEEFLVNWLATNTDPESTQFPVFRTMDADEEDCSFGIKIFAQDNGLHEDVQNLCGNIRRVNLFIGVYQSTNIDGTDDVDFSKFGRTIRVLVRNNLYNVLRTLGDGQDTDMYLHWFQEDLQGEDIEIKGYDEEYNWRSSCSFNLICNGEPLDYGWDVS